MQTVSPFTLRKKKKKKKKSFLNIIVFLIQMPVAFTGSLIPGGFSCFR